MGLSRSLQGSSCWGLQAGWHGSLHVTELWEGHVVAGQHGSLQVAKQLLGLDGWHGSLHVSLLWEQLQNGGLA